MNEKASVLTLTGMYVYALIKLSADQYSVFQRKHTQPKYLRSIQEQLPPTYKKYETTQDRKYYAILSYTHP